MSSAIREWLNLGVRWIHVFAGIMWVGQTYYFTWLDGQFGKLEKKVAANGKASAVWMVHSGGFYSVEKQKSLGSVHYVGGRRGSARSCLLCGGRAHRSGRCGHFEASRNCDRRRRHGGGMDYL